MGAHHGAEIPYVFDNLDAVPDFGTRPDYTEEDRKLARLMHTYWMNFVKFGDPNGESEDNGVSDGALPLWPRKNDAPGHMRFDLNSCMEGDVMRPENELVSPAVEAWMKRRI